MGVSPAVSVRLESTRSEGKSPKAPESPVVKMVLAGTTSFVFELCGGHAAQFLKIQKQTTGLPYSTLMRQITQTKGMIGLLDGFLPWGAIIAVGKGAVFGLGHAGSMYCLNGLVKPGSSTQWSVSEPTAQVISGGVGGFFQGLAANPLLLLNTRVMTNSQFRTEKGFLATSKNSLRLASDIIRTEGPMTLMKGAHILAGKRVLDWTSRFFFVVMVEEWIKGQTQRGLAFKEKCLASITGGVLSCAVTIPLDVMVATVQNHKQAGIYVPVLGTGANILQKGGFSALFAFSTRGFVARATHVGLATLLMKTLTSSLYDVLQSRRLGDVHLATQN
eukprot:CFRG4224T1